jgi:hypothetical protein
MPFFRYDTSAGNSYRFNVPGFRAFLPSIKKPAVVPPKYLVTEKKGPWYDRQEVNAAKLDDIALYWSTESA